MSSDRYRDPSYDFVISRQARNDDYGVWRFRADADDLLTEVPLSPDASFDRHLQLIPVGGYLLAWPTFPDGGKSGAVPYRLFRFDPGSPDPLGAAPLQQGSWPQDKFWFVGDGGEPLQLIPLTSFVLSLYPRSGRGTYLLWNFDPEPGSPGGADPLPAPYTLYGSFLEIQSGHELIPMGNYVLDRLPDKVGYRVWSFDPQSNTPLALPTIQEGRWDTIDASHRLVPVGDRVLDWVPADLSYRLWRFDPDRHDPLRGPVREGRLPSGFDAGTTLLGVQPTIPVRVELSDTPGTIDYMRRRIQHVVYYMLESRSFDNVCGWLYDKDEKGVHFVGSDKPFQGASTELFNDDGDRKVYLSKFRDGRLSEDWDLNVPSADPPHTTPDSLLQMFHKAESGYRDRATPGMGGFVWNAGEDEVMQTLTPEQLPVLNGLARSFAVSDEWFCSIPGGTDVNRAYSLTGSAYDKLATFEGGKVYEYWPETPRRQSIWKVLWSHGITDWRIYNSVLWMDHFFTYHLYLKGQIPTVDQLTTNFLSSVEQFKRDARTGNLSSFSYLEPVWIAPSGSTSYHPTGDLVPGEVALDEIYDALRLGPKWDETLLIVTFDKPGGTYDHVPPPYATNAWPNDVNNGFHFDLMGPRVPTILVSPWIKEKTVFRADGEVPFDSTSFPATLLSWYGIPRERWGLGSRIDRAPTFEGVFSEKSARRDAPRFEPPYDKSYPRRG